MTLPTLYAILDAESCTRRNLSFEAVAEAWREAGIQLLQYRDKQSTDETYLANAAKLKAIFQGTQTILIVNDRVHLLAETNWHGVHIGQTDLTASEARKLIGPGKILGLSTHTPEQVERADREPVDYIAVGPVFGTTTKLDAEPVIGIAGVAAARALTKKPLVAIGGITQQTARSVIQSGAESVAIISALLPGHGDLVKSAQDFLALFK